MLDKKKIVSIIISGGAGTRLWPVSNQKTPKPFFQMPSGKTLLELLLDLLSSVEEISQLVFVTNKMYEKLHKSVLEEKEYNTRFESFFLLEEEGRNTAPAVLMASHFISQELGEDTICLVVTADAVIEDYEEFKKTLFTAVQGTNEENIITFGVVPSYPETGYGYIHSIVDEKTPLTPVKKFVEKPDRKTAEKYVLDKNYFWNSGMFCFSCTSILRAYQTYALQMYDSSRLCWQNIKRISQSHTYFFPHDLFKKIENISIDYAIMERCDSLYVVRAYFRWCDIGNWKTVSEQFAKTGDEENFSFHDAIFVEASNNFVVDREKNCSYSWSR